jgi:ADP-ribosylglycohydrolase
MRAYGTFHQPAGTWSDDSSMVFATIDSLKDGYEREDIMKRFVRWVKDAAYTPFNNVFDRGITSYDAIVRYMETGEITGGAGERDNGNGSLMRILPICLYAYELQKKKGMTDEDAVYMIHEVSALTHEHIRSLIACGLYFFMVRAIIDGEDNLRECLQKGLNEGLAFYKADETDPTELDYYARIMDLDKFAETDVDDIKSTGYVVASLEAALWCLINTDNYKECMLKAVNLGNDTDTVAAIAGGLAGLFYGYDEIPQDWIEVLQKRVWIEDLLMQMTEISLT